MRPDDIQLQLWPWLFTGWHDPWVCSVCSQWRLP